MTKCRQSSVRKTSTQRGFSLLELMVALGVFLMVSGVSFALFSRHEALLSQEQTAVGLNIGLRSALAQVQLDMVNAGDGLILGQNVPAWPVGVTIQNSNPTTSTCNPTATSPPTYASACFDSFNIILVDSATPAANVCAYTGCTTSTSSGTTVTGVFSSGLASSTYAGHFVVGDHVLFIQSCAGGSSGGLANNSSGCKYTTATLTSAGTSTTTGTGCSAGCVTFTFTSTNAGGSNSSANDPLGLTTNAPASQLTDQYGQNDWVVRLNPIQYYVNTSNNLDPQLMRAQGTGTPAVLMDQVVGFKVGAALWNDSNTSSFQYNYLASSYSTPYQYNLIRSVRVTIIGRTAWDATNPYLNPFDNGHYQIRGSSVIVNPRNLTMNND